MEIDGVRAICSPLNSYFRTKAAIISTSQQKYQTNEFNVKKITKPNSSWAYISNLDGGPKRTAKCEPKTEYQFIFFNRFNSTSQPTSTDNNQCKQCCQVADFKILTIQHWQNFKISTSDEMRMRLRREIFFHISFSCFTTIKPFEHAFSFDWLGLQSKSQAALWPYLQISSNCLNFKLNKERSATEYLNVFYWFFPKYTIFWGTNKNQKISRTPWITHFQITVQIVEDFISVKKKRL